MKYCYLFDWLGRKGSGASEELLEVTQLVDRRGWPRHPRLASSKVSTLLSEGRWDLHMGLLQRAKNATQSSANHHRDTDLTGLALSHFAVVAQRGSHNFSKVRQPSGSQAGDGSRYT